MLPNNLKKSMRSTRMVFLASLVLIGAIAIYNWFVAPHQNYLLAAQRYHSITGELAKKNQIISNNVIIKKKEIKELYEKFNQAHNMLFDPAGAREFLSNLQVLSEQENCIIYSLTYSPANLPSDTDSSLTDVYITRHQASLTVIGSYGNIVNLIKKLQDRPQQVDIASVSINSNINVSDGLKSDMTITIYVSHIKDTYKNVQT